MQIVDCGSQYTLNVYRRLRQLGFPLAQGSTAVGYILTGGPESAYDKIVFDRSILESGKPVLGICYGMQALAHLLGGRVEACQKQYGAATVEWSTELSLQIGLDLPAQFEVWMSHGDTVVELPPNFQRLASSNGNIAAMLSNDRQFWAVQWHPEVNESQFGDQLLAAFCSSCGLIPTPPKPIADRCLELIAGLPREKALIAVSGGVDSTTLALLYKIAKRPFLPVFINNGLLRKGEAEEVTAALTALFPNLLTIEAEERFLKALENVIDPDQKRQIIGKEFADLLKEVSDQHNCTWLAQGTLLSDVIESGHSSARSAQIKRHHNLEPQGVPLVEPFRNFFKDEVRMIAAHFGLAQQLNQRMPFPGPGLGVRILGPITRQRCDLLREADAIFQEELDIPCSQAFAALLDSTTVGVAGDQQQYKETVCLRAVQSVDFMTARIAMIKVETLEKIANRILNQVPGVGRVVYDLSSKPPATIELQ